MKVWNMILHASRYGLEIGDPKMNWKQVMHRKNDIIDRFVNGKGPYLQKMGVDLVVGEAQFISKDQIRVESNIYSASRFLIGAGAESVLPDIEGIGYSITSKELLYLEKLPARIVIVGGGIIAMEFAHMLAVAGSKVTLLHRGDRVLKNEDPEISKNIEELSRKQGIDIHLHSHVIKIESDETEQRKVYFKGPEGDGSITVDQVLVATGRKPSLKGLNLATAGVEFKESGILVNDFFQTSNERIYAAGDVIGGPMYTTVAAQEAKVAVRNALKGNHSKLNIRNMSKAVFTLPPIGSVGYTEEQAREEGKNPIVSKWPYSHSGAAILMGETDGFLKVVVDRDTRQIIGAHFVGEEADELIHLITVAIKGRLTVDDFQEIIPVHPTLSETLIEMIRSIEG